jgi:copper chaperone CopZ
MRMFLTLGMMLLAAPAFAQSIRVDIAGMHCEPCATTVKASLEMLPEVKEANVCVKSGKAVLHLRDINAEPSDAALRDAVTRAGYRLEGVKR